MATNRRITYLVALWICTAAIGDHPTHAAPGDGGGPTVVTITDRVLVADCVPFGINLSYGNDSAHASPWAKDRIRASFEGTTYRQCLTGHVRDATGMSVWVGTPAPWRDVLIGAKFTLLNGPGKGLTGTIKDITTKTFVHQGAEKEFTYYVFDREVPPAPKEIGLPGLLVERFALDEGQVARHRWDSSNFWHSNLGQKDKTPRVEVAIGDVPPGSTGRAACLLVAANDGQKAHARFTTFVQHIGQNNGTWLVSFWAKARAGNPTLTVEAAAADPVAPVQTVPLTAQWRKFDLTFRVSGIAEPDWRNPRATSGKLYFIWRAGGGEVLLDEIRARMADEQNPTALRDDLIATLKRLNVGSIRHHQQGGSTLDNILRPAHQAHAFTSQRGARPGPYAPKSRHAISLHDLYELCEYVGCDPWFSLPGTFTHEEMAGFMEYLGAPADVGYGKVRAELGHPRPWTDVFRNIHVELGNEAWNSAGPYHSSGFNGSDYWKDLFAVAKRSEHYRANVLFHAAGQAAYPTRNEGIMKNAPNADRFGVAPYMLTMVRKEDVEFLDTDERFFRWALAWPIFRSRDPRGAMYQNDRFARAAKIEMSVYEFNHHTIEAEGLPFEIRKKIFTTLGGGLNVVHTMLLMLKEHGIRVQNAFPLASGSDHGIWDFALTMRKGHERYRPTFLGMAMVNRVIGGDLVETLHSGADPTWSGEGVFYTEWRKEPQFITYGDIPALTSYAFRDGKDRGLILCNLDLKRALPVRVEFEGGAPDGPARRHLLTADSVTATNEWEVGEPQVRVRTEEVKGFKSGFTLTVPPHSLYALQWQQP